MRTHQKHIVEFPAMFEYFSIANYCKIVNYQNDVWYKLKLLGALLGIFEFNILLKEK
jgi:hypothetical protein